MLFSSASARNQLQMAPAHLNNWFLHSVHPRFKLPLFKDQRCVGVNSSDAQEPFEFDFQHWLRLGQQENNEENDGIIELTALISKLEIRCIIARGLLLNKPVRGKCVLNDLNRMPGPIVTLWGFLLIDIILSFGLAAEDCNRNSLDGILGGFGGRGGFSFSPSSSSLSEFRMSGDDVP